MRSAWPLLLVLLAFATSASAAGQFSNTTAIDRLVEQRMAAGRIPGLALAIVHGDSVTFAKGYGREPDGQPVTSRTQFFIASVTKSFTALAVMQLVEAGRIDLDAPARRYLPEFRTADERKASRITVRNLLNQTSGLADAGFPEGRLEQPATIAGRVASLRAAHSVSAPGRSFHYFNPNYAVLARIIEITAGQPFSAYLEAHIFSPLRMSRTLNVVTSAAAYTGAKYLAQGHLVLFGFAFPCREMNGYLGGSGGVISTAEDMANFLVMQNHGGSFEHRQLATPQSIALMHAPPPGIAGNHGIGWLRERRNTTTLIEHNGILSAFYADVVLLPDTGDGFVLLYDVNSLPSMLLAFPRLKAGLIALLTGRKPATGHLTVGMLGAVTGAITLICIGFAVRSLTRLNRWAGKAGGIPMWRQLLGILGLCLPALALLALPRLVSLTGRSFGYQELFRTWIDIFLLLGICGALGIVNAAARIFVLVRKMPAKAIT